MSTIVYEYVIWHVQCHCYSFFQTGVSYPANLFCLASPSPYYSTEPRRVIGSLFWSVFVLRAMFDLDSDNPTRSRTHNLKSPSSRPSSRFKGLRHQAQQKFRLYSSGGGVAYLANFRVKIVELVHFKICLQTFFISFMNKVTSIIKKGTTFVCTIEAKGPLSTTKKYEIFPFSIMLRLICHDNWIFNAFLGGTIVCLRQPRNKS